MAVVLAAHPKRSLELLKYQTLICAAFAKYPAEACLEYDRCFRLQASKDSKLTWGKYKEDIFIWCFAPKPASAGLGTHASAWEAQTFRPKAHAWDAQPFRNRMGLGARLGPPPDTVTHTPGGEEICIRFNTKRGCSANEDGSKCKFEHSCNRRGCGGKHSASKCPSKPKSA